MKGALLLVRQVVEIRTMLEQNFQRAGTCAGGRIMDWLPQVFICDVDLWVLGKKLFNHVLIGVDGSEMQWCHVLVAEALLCD